MARPDMILRSIDLTLMQFALLTLDTSFDTHQLHHVKKSDMIRQELMV